MPYSGWLLDRPRSPSSACPCQLLLATSKLLSTVNDRKTTRRVSGENGLLSENRKAFIENFDTQEQTHHHRKLPQAIFYKAWHPFNNGWRNPKSLGQTDTPPRAVKKRAKWDHKLMWYRLLKLSGNYGQILRCEKLNSQSSTCKWSGLLPKAALKGFL